MNAIAFPLLALAAMFASPALAQCGTSGDILSSSAPAEELHWRKPSPPCLSAKRKAESSAPATAKMPAAQPAPNGGAYRFNMSQGGKRMTADEFDAWMKANGIRIAGAQPVKEEEKPAEEPAKKKKK